MHQIVLEESVLWVREVVAVTFGSASLAEGIPDRLRASRPKVP
jgi:hypothetical protein